MKSDKSAIKKLTDINSKMKVVIIILIKKEKLFKWFQSYMWHGMLANPHGVKIKV